MALLGTSVLRVEDAHLLVRAPPALQNAAVDALSHLGVRHLSVRHLDLPVTPERIWRAVAARGKLS
jgi:carbon-monoxide dehydrogenase large subunit